MMVAVATPIHNRRRTRASRQWLGLEALEPRVLMCGESAALEPFTAHFNGPFTGPIIDEIMAVNDGTLEDADGDYSDWIEIHNPTPLAVDMTGWHLTDDPADLTMWTFPQVTLEPGGYLIVFASNKPAIDPAIELRANFKLNGGGDYLALVEPDGLTIAHEYAPQFPRQVEDLSYGLAQDVTPLVEAGAAATVLIPTDDSLGSAWTLEGFDDAAWLAGPTGVGFETGAGQGIATAYGYLVGAIGTQDYTGSLGHDFVVNTTITVTELGVFDSGADGLMRDLRAQLWTRSGNTGTLITELSFTGADPGVLVDSERFKPLAAPVQLTPGDYTIVAYGYGAGEPNGNAGGNGPFDDHKTVDDGGEAIGFVGGARFGAAGAFPATPDGGPFNRYSAGTFRFASPAYSNLIATDVTAPMQGVNATAYVRIPFDVTDPAAFDSLSLNVQYDDGFVAYLNGFEVARRNAPATPAWDSSAVAARPLEDSLAVQRINITAHLDKLAAGPNVLAIQGLNVDAGDNDFLVLPELIAAGAPSGELRYFDDPTPGGPNDSTTSFAGFVDEITISVDHGFFDAPFDVEITTPTAGAEIRYTTDGSAPTATTGTLYTGPIHVAGLTTLRAAAFATDLRPTTVRTRSYMFLNDVFNQTAAPAGFPTTWNGITPDYAFDQDPANLALIAGDPVYTQAEYEAIIEASLLALPTMSIVMDVDDLFGAQDGIYANPTYRGVAWERPASVEYILPDGTAGFQINAGLRIMGFTSRSPGLTPKHSLRILFKKDYGPGRLSYQFFADSPIDSFNTLALRANARDAWAYTSASTYLRDQWAKAAQAAMGVPATSGNFVHLFVNGLYWGVYNPTERPDAAFAAEQFGGSDADYDAIKFCCSTRAVDGDMTKWNQLIGLASNGLGSDAQYQLVQGNNPDGTRNPDYDVLLDVDNLIDYMIAGQYHASGDWPGNYFAIRDRTAASTGFKFFTWDNDLAFPGLNLNADKTGFDNFTNNTPGYIDRSLRQNAEYLLRFADHVQRHYFNGGDLTPQAAAQRWIDLANGIEQSLIAEAARWGDTQGALDTPDGQWQTNNDYMINTYFPQRSQIVLNQLRSRGLYPSVDAPSFNQHGGDVPQGFMLEINKPAGSAGVVYFTMDGSDPRLTGGAVAPGAQTYTDLVTLDTAVHVEARLLEGGVWSALLEATFIVDVPPALRITELMYHPADGPGVPPVDGDLFEFIELLNVGPDPLNLAGFAVSDGVEFTFPDMTLAPGQYTVIVKDLASFQSRYPDPTINIAGQYDLNLSNSGEHILLVGPVGEVILDFTYSDLWQPQTDGPGRSLVILDALADPATWNDAASWRASTLTGGSPGKADPPPISLDVDLNGTADALTDGTLITRYLFGFRGNALVADAVGPGAQRAAAADITTYLDTVAPVFLDVDANGGADALTDAILISRYLFGFTGLALTQGALATNATRSDPNAIAAFLDPFNPNLLAAPASAPTLLSASAPMSAPSPAAPAAPADPRGQRAMALLAATFWNDASGVDHVARFTLPQPLLRGSGVRYAWFDSDSAGESRLVDP